MLIYSLLLYIDATVLLCTSEDYYSIDHIENINNELQNNNVWLSTRKHTLTITKPKVMLFFLYTEDHAWLFIH